MNHFIALAQQLAPILQSYRKQKGLTQKELADKTGLLPKTISLLENNPERTRIENLFRVASCLELEIHVVEKSSNGISDQHVEW